MELISGQLYLSAIIVDVVGGDQLIHDDYVLLISMTLCMFHPLSALSGVFLFFRNSRVAAFVIIVMTCYAVKVFFM